MACLSLCVTSATPSTDYRMVALTFITTPFGTHNRTVAVEPSQRNQKSSLTSLPKHRVRRAWQDTAKLNNGTLFSRFLGVLNTIPAETTERGWERPRFHHQTTTCSAVARTQPQPRCRRGSPQGCRIVMSDTAVKCRDNGPAWNIREQKTAGPGKPLFQCAHERDNHDRDLPPLTVVTNTTGVRAQTAGPNT